MSATESSDDSSDSTGSSLTDDILNTIHTFETERNLPSLDWKMDYFKMSDSQSDDVFDISNTCESVDVCNDACTDACAGSCDSDYESDDDDDDDIEDDDDIFDGFMYNETDISNSDNRYHPHSNENEHKVYYEYLLVFLEQNYSECKFAHETIFLNCKRIDRLLWKVSDDSDDEDLDQ